MFYTYLVALANLLFGISLGWLPPTLQLYNNANDTLSFTDEDCSAIVSAQYVGSVVGCVLLTFIVDTFGRNAVIVTAAILSLVSWVGVAFSQKVILHLLIRLVAGISIGLSNTIMSIYIGENSGPGVRGIFNSGTALFVDCGMLLGCTVTTIYSYETSAYIIVAFALMNVSSAVLLREPAQHLLAKGRLTEAENQFFRLRGRNEDTEKEFEDIKMNSTGEKTAFSFSFILDRHFLIACVTSMLIYLTGFPAVSAMVSIILMPTEQFSTNELAILFELFQLVGAIISPFIIDCFGRRTLWMVSAISIAIIHFFTAALYFAAENDIEIPLYEWLLFGSITAYAAIFAVAMYPLGIIARAELLPQRLRIIGTCIASVLNAMTGTVVGYSFLWVASDFGIQTNFIVYAVFSLITLIICYLYLPETQGMALTEIEKMLEKPKKEKTTT